MKELALEKHIVDTFNCVAGMCGEESTGDWCTVCKMSLNSLLLLLPECSHRVALLSVGWPDRVRWRLGES